ncbi:MAG: hypothetical protein PHQ40_10235 [Anaerolineaceae bacterium]|nr:hypothetical protein [Anaerolineaceae bacterium]
MNDLNEERGYGEDLCSPSYMTYGRKELPILPGTVRWALVFAPSPYNTNTRLSPIREKS